MMMIEPQQIKIIQAISQGKFSSRTERLEFYSDFLFREIDSTKELTKDEANDVITYFKTGKVVSYIPYALFDKNNPRHMKILSLAKELDWMDDKTGYADLERLGAWIKSPRCPAGGKKLKEMNHKELSKVVRALENMVFKKYTNDFNKNKNQNDELSVINQIVDLNLRQQAIPTPETRLVESILYETADKLLKKQVTERNNLKIFKISLKYHQGYALCFVLNSYRMITIENAFVNMVVNKVADEIQRQL